ncbi:hypothetical protein ACH5RR_009334 [Cinchona calisaya]|uniref:Uncharacterized protein n=1 Tax=Cinchona calisaya TaxID=153742 RepID=A0ABD3AHD8_9GENT
MQSAWVKVNSSLSISFRDIDTWHIRNALEQLQQTTSSHAHVRTTMKSIRLNQEQRPTSGNSSCKFEDKDVYSLEPKEGGNLIGGEVTLVSPQSHLTIIETRGSSFSKVRVCLANKFDTAEVTENAEAGPSTDDESREAKKLN